LVDTLNTVFRRTDAQGAAALVAVLRDAVPRPALAGVRTSTLLLHGELDPLITDKKIETLAQNITSTCPPDTSSPSKRPRLSRTP
jgi:hypothetical protein